MECAPALHSQDFMKFCHVPLPRCLVCVYNSTSVFRKCKAKFDMIEKNNQDIGGDSILKCVRFPKRDWTKMRNCAERLGITISEFIVDACMRCADSSPRNPSERPWVSPPQCVRWTKEDLGKVASAAKRLEIDDAEFIRRSVHARIAKLSWNQILLR